MTEPDGPGWDRERIEVIIIEMAHSATTEDPPIRPLPGDADQIKALRDDRDRQADLFAGERRMLEVALAGHRATQGQLEATRAQLRAMTTQRDLLQVAVNDWERAGWEEDGDGLEHHAG